MNDKALAQIARSLDIAMFTKLAAAFFAKEGHDLALAAAPDATAAEAHEMATTALGDSVNMIDDLLLEAIGVHDPADVPYAVIALPTERDLNLLWVLVDIQLHKNIELLRKARVPSEKKEYRDMTKHEAALLALLTK